MKKERLQVPATVSTATTTGQDGQPIQQPVKLEFQFIHQKAMAWLLIAYDSYSRERNLLQDISVHGLPIDIPELRTQDPALFAEIDAAMRNNAGTYWDDQDGTDKLVERVQGPIEKDSTQALTGSQIIDHSAPQVENLMEGVLREMNRVRWVIKEYEQLPGNAGYMGAQLMKAYLTRTEKAISSSDTIELLVCYELLKECEPEMQQEEVRHA